ncbi:MAG: futalosine hydrolase [Flavobacteriales bacterium]
MPTLASNILLVAATKAEMPTTVNPKVDMLVTGVGMVATTHVLTKELSKKQYDLVVDVGIGGSFNPAIKIGDVVQVTADRLVELGVEDNGKFVPAHEMDLVNADELMFETELTVSNLTKANGITVNTVHGTQETIAAVVKQFNPDVETMEGAAVAYVCQQFDVPWVQIRAISNRVEPRNRAAWNINLAIKNLQESVNTFLDALLK